MKLANKRFVLFICTITMVIGVASILYTPVGTLIPQTGDTAMAIKANRMIKQTVQNSEQDTKDTISLMSISTTPTPSPTPIPTPTPLPVYSLEEEGYPAGLDQLIETYYEAKICCDIDTLKSISSDPDNVISKKHLLQLVEGIDEYENIKCYIKKSYEEGSYIAFVYYDIRFIGLKTLAPSLAKLYIITDEAGEFKIFDGEVTEELKAYISARSEDEDVIELRNYTDQRAEKAKEKDEDLKAFWEIIDKY